MSWSQARYVESLIKQGGHEALFGRRAALTLALPGSTGIRVHASVSNVSKRTKLEAEKNKWAVRSGVGLSGEQVPFGVWEACPSNI